MGARDLKLGRRNQITLPAELVPKGTTQFRCEKRGSAILLIPCTTIPTSQIYFWTKQWQEGEERASSDILAGRLSRYASVRELLAHLDKKRKKNVEPPPLRPSDYLKPQRRMIIK